MSYSKPFNGNYFITSPFGMRWGKLHTGIDWGCPQGTPLLAILDGTVTVSQKDQYGANWVDIRLSNGYLARYLHLSRRDVKVGQKVNKGQVIGLSGGAKGTEGAGQSTGSHLHLAISKSNDKNFFNYDPEITSQWTNTIEPKPPMPPQPPTFQHFDILKDYGQGALTAFQVMSTNATNFGGLESINQPTRDKVLQVVTSEPDMALTYLCQEIGRNHQTINSLNGTIGELNNQISITAPTDNTELQNQLNTALATIEELKKAKPEEPTNSSDKKFFESKKWLSNFLNSAISMGILLFQTSQISPSDDWETIATKLGSAVVTILGINVVNTSYISGQSKVDTAAAENKK